MLPRAPSSSELTHHLTYLIPRLWLIVIKTTSIEVMGEGL